MRSTIVAGLAAIGLGFAGTAASLAAPVNGAAINDAAGTLQMTEQVHCVPGFAHHYPTSFRRRDGCARGPVVVRPPVVVVRPGVRHRHRHFRRHRF
jgi:hypothetical protein